MRAWRLVFDFAVDFKPDEIIILGDFYDNYSISRFDKDPKKDFRFLSEELASGTDAMRELDKRFPRAKFIFLEGNHEYRLKHYVYKNAGKIGDLIDVKPIFGVPSRWHYIHSGYNGHYKHGNWVATHGTLFSEHVCANMIKKYGCNVIFGHTHRYQDVLQVKFDGRTERAITIGWLADPTAADYVKDVQNNQHAFAVGYFKPNGEGFVQPILIQNYQAVAEGRFYKK